MRHIYVKYIIKNNVGIPEKIITQKPCGQRDEGSYGINRSDIARGIIALYPGLSNETVSEAK
jgi:hypothetical protein